MAKVLTQIVQPHKVASQSIYDWAAGNKNPNIYQLYFIYTRTQDGTPAREWARRCLHSRGFDAWIDQAARDVTRLEGE
jgi:hypothetical protein